MWHSSGASPILLQPCAGPGARPDSGVFLLIHSRGPLCRVPASSGLSLSGIAPPVAGGTLPYLLYSRDLLNMTDQWSLRRTIDAVSSEGDIALIGNGPRLIERQDGAKIDACSVIVRITDGRWQGFEAHAGSRTDIRFIGVPLKARLQPFFRELNEISRIVSPDFNKDVLEAMPHLKTVEYFPNFNRLRSQAFRQLRSVVEVETIPEKNPRSGIVLLSLMTELMQRGRLIRLFGFDTEMRSGGAEHYYQDGRKLDDVLKTWDDFHCPMEVEFALLHRMRDKGLIEIN